MYLVAEGLAPTTVSKRLQFARMFFKAAKKRNLIAANPFAEVSAAAVMQCDRQRYVTREETERLLAICDPTWRLIVALSRFGGLRCPSEVLSLRWQDINWENDRMEIQSPKTEHHEGKASRSVPIFAELRQFLQEAFEVAPEGAVYVVDERLRKAAQGKNGWRNCNLRTQFERLVKRAGLKPWPRLFHALRASRETELAKHFPIHVVSGWLGNTPKIAAKHYLMATDDDFAKASQGGAKSGAVAVQNPVQQPSAQVRNNEQKNDATPCEGRGLCEFLQLGARRCNSSERRGQDSNLRTSFPVTDLANRRFRPLSHLSDSTYLGLGQYRATRRRVDFTAAGDGFKPMDRQPMMSSRASLAPNRIRDRLNGQSQVTAVLPRYEHRTQLWPWQVRPFVRAVSTKNPSIGGAALPARP